MKYAGFIRISSKWKISLVYSSMIKKNIYFNVMDSVKLLNDKKKYFILFFFLEKKYC